MTPALPPLPRYITAILVMESDLMNGQDLEAEVQAWGEQCAREAKLAEREACAKVCEQHAKRSLVEERPIAYVYGARECAAAIRARKD